MAVYTCYDMIRDCREDKPEGWEFFVKHYVPVCRELIGHYYPGRAADTALLGRVTVALRKPDSSLFAAEASEREFMARLRQDVLAAVEVDEASAPAGDALDLETLGEALAPLTPVEKQAAWLEGMRYSPESAGALMMMDPATVRKVRERAGELLRGKVDTWSAGMIAANGGALGLQATAARTGECYSIGTYLAMLDGRMTWAEREAVERHMNECWFCVDHFCRTREVDAILKRAQPLTPGEAKPYRDMLGLKDRKKSFWKKFTG